MLSTLQTLFHRISSVLSLYGFSGLLRVVSYELRYYLRSLYYKSYSQHAEDLIVSDILRNTIHTHYIDIGAHDPRRFSNTKRLYDRGWSGLNIEPDVRRFATFLIARPRDVNLNVLVGDEGTNTLYRFHTSTLNTIDRSVADRYIALGFPLVDNTSVSSFPAHHLWSQYMGTKMCSFMNVDVEGAELQVLQSNNWNVLMPTVVCIETKPFAIPSNASAPHDVHILDFMTRLGYTVHAQTSVNTIFVRL